jgi:hypothetical protein
MLQVSLHPNIKEMLEHLFVKTLLNTVDAWQQPSINNQV